MCFKRKLCKETEVFSTRATVEVLLFFSEVSQFWELKTSPKN